MAAQHSLSGPDTALGERDLSPVIHLNEAVAHQPLERFGHRRRSHAKLLRQPRPDNRLTFHTDVINRFQILFHRRAEWFFRFHGLSLPSLAQATFNRLSLPLIVSRSQHLRRGGTMNPPAGCIHLSRLSTGI